MNMGKNQRGRGVHQAFDGSLKPMASDSLSFQKTQLEKVWRDSCGVWAARIQRLHWWVWNNAVLCLGRATRAEFAKLWPTNEILLWMQIPDSSTKSPTEPWVIHSLLETGPTSIWLSVLRMAPQKLAAIPVCESKSVLLCYLFWWCPAETVLMSIPVAKMLTNCCYLLTP